MLKKALIYLVVAFAVYSLVSTPDTAAEAVRGAGEGLSAAGSSVIQFFDALTP